MRAQGHVCSAASALSTLATASIDKSSPCRGHIGMRRRARTMLPGRATLRSPSPRSSPCRVEAEQCDALSPAVIAQAARRSRADAGRKSRSRRDRFDRRRTLSADAGFRKVGGNRLPHCRIANGTDERRRETCRNSRSGTTAGDRRLSSQLELEGSGPSSSPISARSERRRFRHFEGLSRSPCPDPKRLRRDSARSKPAGRRLRHSDSNRRHGGVE